jgi:hypothetical protein
MRLRGWSTLSSPFGGTVSIHYRDQNMLSGTRGLAGESSSEELPPPEWLWLPVTALGGPCASIS